MHHVDFAREEVDLAVRHGDGNWAGLSVELRLLVANDLLSRSPTSRGLLDRFLTCRAKPNSGILFQRER
jgi:hypothetical protein